MNATLTLPKVPEVLKLIEDKYPFLWEYIKAKLNGENFAVKLAERFNISRQAVYLYLEKELNDFLSEEGIKTLLELLYEKFFKAQFIFVEKNTPVAKILTITRFYARKFEKPMNVMETIDNFLIFANADYIPKLHTFMKKNLYLPISYKEARKIFEENELTVLHLNLAIRLYGGVVEKRKNDVYIVDSKKMRGRNPYGIALIYMLLRGGLRDADLLYKKAGWEKKPKNKDAHFYRILTSFNLRVDNGKILPKGEYLNVIEKVPEKWVTVEELAKITKLSIPSVRFYLQKWKNELQEEGYYRYSFVNDKRKVFVYLPAFMERIKNVKTRRFKVAVN